MRHFLEIDDLSPGDLARVLELARMDPAPAVLARQGVALLFEKPSSRTRNASEMAVFQLGGHPITIRGEEVGFDRRETAEDLTRVLGLYHAAIGARVFDHKVLERMAAVSTVPVINLLSDLGHPCQALADLLTLRQHFGRLAGLKIAWVGDGNNVCRSLLLGASLVGADFSAACPPGFQPDPGAVDVARRRGISVTVTSDVALAVSGADVVSTDTWVSMGQEEDQAARRSAFAGYTVDPSVMAGAASGAVFFHCLPAHRGEEVTDEVIDGPQSLVWPQAANRLHAFRGLLLWLFS